MPGDSLHNVCLMAAPTPPDTDASPAPALVAALVVTRRTGDVAAVVGAVAGQVYEPNSIFVVSAAELPGELPDGVTRVGSVPDALAQLDAATSFVWFVDQDARPRRDALGALVATANQVDASVVGSKILRADAPEELISVGEATDVFGHPYSGLEAGERDQEQYDVIRDVAFVESASVLVRRDLAMGLGGLDHRVPYLASGLDLCQRARLAGGRVVVAPASEVLFEGYRGDRAITWREQAGRIRAMLKVYSAVTLLWAIPGLAIIGLLAALYRSFNGRPLALLDWGRAWMWNGLHLPSSVAERTRARRSRQAGDEELFRYQITGSVEMRGLASQLGALIQDETEEDEQDLEELFDQNPGFWQQPGFIASAFGFAFVAFFTRSLLSDGMPAVGYTLPLSSDPWGVLTAAAGGWHLGGLGSPEPMHPAVAATAAVQHLSRMGPALAATLLTVAAVALAILGVVRLLRRSGIGQLGRFAAAVVVVAGPAAASLGSVGYWPGLLAIGTLPWTLAAVLEPLPSELRPRIGRIARVALVSGWTAAMVPPLVLAPIVFGLVWGLGTANLAPLRRGVLVTLLGVPFLFPWLAAQDPVALLSAGEPFHLGLSIWSAGAIGLAAIAAILTASGAALRVSASGALLATAGALLARSGSFGTGLDVTVAGALVASVGSTMVVAGAFEGISSLGNAGAIRRSGARLATVAGAVAVATTLALVPAGRAGLAADAFGSELGFAQSRADEHGADRLLLMGDASDLPGASRRLADGTAYRVVSGPQATFPQAWLPSPRLGDDELVKTITRLSEETEQRPGETLVPFGIKWLVFATDEFGSTVSGLMDHSLTSQLDLRPLPQLDVAVFENELLAARAIDDMGTAWRYETGSYRGPAEAGSVLVRENADPRWGPGTWAQDGWANRLGSSSGVAEFAGVPSLRLIGRLVGLLAIVALVAAIWGRLPTKEADE